MPKGSKVSKCRVVIDTNIFISGLNFKGTPREILNLAWKEKIENYISLFILQEIEKILAKDFNWARIRIKKVLKKIKEKSKIIYPKTRISIIKEKKDDNRILECAIAAETQYLISRDKRHILPLKQYKETKILSPADFLKILTLRKK
ncbi:MAG: putative toxin-antitoxin system toxin component, PIN family [Patescibacteria group bacterium]|nr:putative toxin-antitoxin system toxin component, PIN family [Patescibacteria group bacterium]